MDIYDYLKMDHKKVAKLFELFESATTDRNRLETFALLKKELLLHADAEANTFYKTLEVFYKAEDEALHGEEEHEEIKNKIEEISQLKQQAAIIKKVLELKKLVEHHVSEEEGKIFKAAKKVISDEEAYILKEQMHDYKDKLLYGSHSKIKEEVFE